MDLPIPQTADYKATKKNCGDPYPSPTRPFALLGDCRNCSSPDIRVSLLPEFDKLACALGAFQNVKVFWIREIELFRRVDPGLQGLVIDATDPVGIWILFEDVRLKLFKNHLIIVLVRKDD